MRIFCLILTFTLAGASAAFAQAQPTAYVGGGLTLPVGNAEEYHGRGYNFGSRFSWPLTRYFAVVGAIEYRDLRRDDEATVRRLHDEGDRRWADYREFRLGGGFLDGGHRTSLAALAHAQLMLRPGSGRLSYHLLAGGGLARAGTGDLHVYFLGENDDYEGASEYAAALDVGAGLGFQLSPGVGIFAQASYLTLLTEGASNSMIPVQLGMSFIMSDRFVR
jgi:hypothetical protein